MNTDSTILSLPPKTGDTPHDFGFRGVTCNSTRRQANRGADADVTCQEDDFDLSFGSSDLPAIPVPAQQGSALSAWEAIRQAQDAFLKARCA